MIVSVSVGAKKKYPERTKVATRLKGFYIR
jgi:hypothetical protein